MKHIFLLTDFSDKARNAASYAVQLFRDQPVTFTLINAFDIEYCGTPYISQVRNDLANDSIENLKDEKELLLKIVPTAKIETAARFGPLVEVINAEHSETPADIAVVGCEDESILENFLLGSNTYELIKFATMPLLVIPGHSRFSLPSKITFATDMQTIDNEDMATPIIDIAKRYGSKVMFLNIAEGKNPCDCEAAKTQLARMFNASEITFNTAQGNDVRNTILYFMDETQSDICTLVHRDLGLIDRMFKPSITKKMILEPQHPMFILRA